MQPAPTGVSGELYIGGDGLARGYHNNPELTARSFVPDPFADRDGARLYRTGDLVKRAADGSIQFLGRLDSQVKVRGYRIELGDIESHLNQHPDVKNAVVVVHESSVSSKRLVAYFVPDGKGITAKDLRDYLAGELPGYMVPSAFVRLDRFPLTPNGKIDRKALKTTEILEEERTSELRKPRDEIEQKLIRIWENVLGVKQVSTRDNFFDLGGDSLVAARLFAEVEKQMGRSVPLATLFHSPTVEGIADVLRSKSVEALWSTVVPIRETGKGIPLFLVHGAEGNILLYQSLQRHLSEDLPVYGLQSGGLDGKTEYRPTIEAIAARYVEAVRQTQPHGPYLLGGYCMGGTVALEMAQQLKRAGDEVALLAMLETYNARRMTAPTWHIHRRDVQFAECGISRDEHAVDTVPGKIVLPEREGEDRADQDAIQERHACHQDAHRIRPG